MKYLSASVLLFLASQVYAGNCVERKLGEYNKSLWGHSIAAGFKGELFKQISDRDFIFDNIDPELSFSLPLNFDLDVKFNRRVEDFLPAPIDMVLGPLDKKTYRIKDQVDINLKSSHGYNPHVSTGIAGGLNLAHLSQYDQTQKDRCDFLKTIISNNERGSVFLKANCQKRTRSIYAKYYDKFINIITSPLKKLLQKLARGTKQKIHAKDPFAPLKLHSLLGVPINLEVFSASNTDILVGDILEHTTYIAANWLGVHFDLFSGIAPNYSRFKRYIRRVAYKKLKNNKVRVDIVDTQLSGDGYDYLKISPKILGILKLNLGKWGNENFSEQSLTQSFEIDLNGKKGKEFLEIITIGQYNPNLTLTTPLLSSRYEEYAEEVKVFDPVFKNGNGITKNLSLKFFNELLYQNRSVQNYARINFKDDEFRNVGPLHQQKRKSNISFNLGPIVVSKYYSDKQCQMQMNIGESTKKRLNINCKYENKFADKDDLKNLYNALYIATNNELEAENLEPLKEASFSGKNDLRYFQQLSFSNDDITRIIESSEERITAEISKMFFGEKKKNVFSPKYKQQWLKVKRNRQYKSKLRDRNVKSCSNIFKKYGITSEFDAAYDNFEGVVGKKSNLYNLTQYSCYDFYVLSQKTLQGIISIRKAIYQNQNSQNVMQLFPKINYSVYIQNLLLRLSKDEKSTNEIRYAYGVESSAIHHLVQASNGEAYSLNLMELPETLFDEINTKYNERFDKIEIKSKKCKNKNALIIKLKLNYDIERLEDIKLGLKLHVPSVRRKQAYLETNVFLSEMEFKDGYYTAQIPLPRKHNWNRSYIASFMLLNSDDISLSENARLLVNKLFSY